MIRPWENRAKDYCPRWEANFLHQSIMPLSHYLCKALYFFKVFHCFHPERATSCTRFVRLPLSCVIFSEMVEMGIPSQFFTDKTGLKIFVFIDAMIFAFTTFVNNTPLYGKITSKV